MASKLETQNNLLAQLLAKMEESQKNEPEKWKGDDSGNTKVAEVETYDGIADVLEEFSKDRMEIVDVIEEIGQKQSGEIDKLSKSLGIFSEIKIEKAAIQNDVPDRISEALAFSSKTSEVGASEDFEGIEDEISAEPSPLEQAFAEMMNTLNAQQTVVITQPITEPDIGLREEIRTIAEPEPIIQEVSTNIPYIEGLKERTRETFDIMDEPESKLGGRPTLDGDYIGDSLEKAFKNFGQPEDDFATSIDENTREMKSVKEVLETISDNTGIIANAFTADKYNDDYIEQAEEPENDSKLKGIQENAKEAIEEKQKKDKKDEESWFGNLIGKYALPVLGGITAVASLGKHVTKPIEFEEIEQEDLSSILRLTDEEKEAREERENEMALEAAASRGNWISDAFSDLGNSVLGAAKSAAISAIPGVDLLNTVKNLFASKENEKSANENDIDLGYESDPFFNKKEVSVNAESSLNTQAQSIAVPEAAKSEPSLRSDTGVIVEREPVKATPAQDQSFIAQQMISEQKNSSDNIVNAITALAANINHTPISKSGIYTLTSD